MQLTKKDKEQIAFLLGDLYVDVDMKAVQYLGAFTKEEKDITNTLRENLRELKDLLGIK
jgi:hypothetical protein